MVSPFSSYLVKDQEAQYKLLLDLQTELLTFMKDGVSCRDVYQHAVDFIKEKNPDLEKAFVKNLGFSVSLKLFFPFPATKRPIDRD